MGDGTGKQLINLIKKRQRTEALEILKKKPDITTTDQSGRTALHLAAAEGYDEIVEKLILDRAEVECWDNSGQTPVHKAARDGHVKALVILVAHGALINTMDWRLSTNRTRTNKSSFENNRNFVRIWSISPSSPLGLDEQEELNNKEIKMKEMVLSQLPRVPGFKYGGIEWKIVYVEEKGNIEMTDLKITVTPKSRVRRPFYLYCCRMQSDYVSEESFLSENDSRFSAVYEIRNWKMMKTTFIFTIVVEGQPRFNEEVVLASSAVEEGVIEMVDISDIDETTHINLKMTLVPDDVTRFTLCLREKSPETYMISNDGLKINPKLDDSASIDIPEGILENPTEMSLEVTQTKPKSTNRKSSIRTNIWNLVLDSKIHGKSDEPMEVHLHIHLPKEARDEVAFINTSSENPEDEDDWHIIDSQTKTSKGVKVKCTFNRRLSIGGVSKKLLSENKKQVTEDLNNYKRNMHEVVFLVMTKLQDIQSNVFSLVVDCGTPVNAERNRNRWLREGYDKEQWSQTIIVKNFQTFRLSLKEHKDDPCVYLTFQSHRQAHNFRMLEFTMPNGRGLKYDEIVIELVRLIQPEAIVDVVKGSGCCSMKENKVLVPKPIKKLENLCSLPVSVKFPPVFERLDPNHDDFNELEEDDECMISVLRYTSLKALSAALTLNDGKHIASQLKISQPIYFEIMKNQKSDHQKVFQILAAWRGNQPYLAMVDSLIYALRSCNKHTLANDVADAAKLNNVLRSIPNVTQNK